jgi:hypothetical protein
MIEKMPSRREFLVGVGGLASTAILSAPASTTDSPALTWERTYTPTDQGFSLVRDLVPMGDGIALVGLAGDWQAYRGWIGKVNSAGRSRWHRILGSESSAFLAGTSTVDDPKGVMTAGWANETPGVPASTHADPYVSRARSNGKVSWARTYQPAASNGRSNALASVDKGYVIAGSKTVEGHGRPWAAYIDTHGTQTWTWQDTRAGTVNDAIGVSSGVVVGGSTWAPGSDVSDSSDNQETAWIAKFTTDGDIAWQWRVDHKEGDRIEALASRPNGGVVAIGRRSFTTYDDGVGWLVALDTNGRQLWERTYPQDAGDWHQDITPVDNGYVLVGTREAGPDTDARGAWLLRVTTEGRVVWDYQAETGTRGFAGLALADGGFLVGGDRYVDDRDQAQAWLAKVGGDPASAAANEDALAPPALPGWWRSFLAGGVLGALGMGAAAYWRRS